jgi:hypothetical protein
MLEIVSRAMSDLRRSPKKDILRMTRSRRASIPAIVCNFGWYNVIKCWVKACSNSIVTAVLAFGMGSCCLDSRWVMAYWIWGVFIKSYPYREIMCWFQ